MEISNKRRRNDIEEITEEKAITILNVLDDYPSLYKSLQAITDLHNDILIFNPEIIDKINKNPKDFFEYLSNRVSHNIKTYLSEYMYVEFSDNPQDKEDMINEDGFFFFVRRKGYNKLNKKSYLDREFSAEFKIYSDGLYKYLEDISSRLIFNGYKIPLGGDLRTFVTFEELDVIVQLTIEYS